MRRSPNPWPIGLREPNPAGVLETRAVAVMIGHSEEVGSGYANAGGERYLVISVALVAVRTRFPSTSPPRGDPPKITGRAASHNSTRNPCWCEGDFAPGIRSPHPWPRRPRAVAATDPFIGPPQSRLAGSLDFPPSPGAPHCPRVSHPAKSGR